jgi:putative colanic acid biosynthesis glycosyltransferase
MDKNPYFSIISIHLNHAGGLRRTHNSIKNQSFQDYEWIVIDGGSHPAPPPDIMNYATYALSEPDRGIYNAMNKGLAAARGDYILFLNAGDQLTGPDVLFQLAEAIKAEPTPPDFIYGDSLEDDNGTITRKPARSHNTLNLGMFTHHQAMLYRREAIGTARFNENYKIAADYDFTLQILKHNPPVLYCPLPLCIFEAGGISQTSARTGRREQFTIRRAHKTVHVLENIFIYTLQTAVWEFRKFFPKLYWRLKSGGNNHNGSSQT